MLQPGDDEVRGVLTRSIAALGYAPELEALAAAAGRTPHETGEALRRLHDAHALLLHPGSLRPWVVHPFALAPAACWVESGPHGYWASCLYCALGIAAALRGDAVITTRLGGERDALTIHVRDRELVDPGGVFHLSTPVARWWDNVTFACSSFQPFRSEAEVDAWCARHQLPRGAVLEMPRLWAFARDWYGHYLDIPWRKRTREEAVALFEHHGLTGAFWAI